MIIGGYFRMRADKYEVLGTLPQSQRTFVVSGYAAAKAVPAVQKAIGEAFDCVIDVEELKEEGRPYNLVVADGGAPAEREDLEKKLVEILPDSRRLIRAKIGAALSIYLGSGLLGAGIQYLD